MNPKKEIRIAIIVMMMCFSIGIVSCKKDTSYSTPETQGTTGNSGMPGSNEVFIQGMNFNPSTITVSAGQSVTWTNKDNISHTVTSDSPMFDSGSLSNGGTFSFNFPNAGTYNYHCSFHPGMTAKVVVQ
jgi:plastocyanin